MDKLEVAIRRSVNIAKQHGQTLNANLIIRRLLSEENWPEREIKEKWAKMYQGNNYDKTQAKWSRIKFKKAKIIGELLSRIKWVKMVAVTGSVAMRNAKYEDDIDLFVVTQNNRLWLVRLLSTIWLRVTRGNLRKLREPDPKDKICINLWLEERSLAVVAHKRTLGAAIDCVNMEIVAGDKGWYGEFLRENTWISQFLASGYHKRLENNFPIRKNRAKNLVLDGLNLVAYYLQLRYMRPRMTKEIVSQEVAYFHPRLI